MRGMGDPSRRWFRFRLRTLLLLTLLAVVGLSVYSYWSDYMDEATRRERELLSPPRGAVCTIVLRAESLGLERMSPRAGEYNGVSNEVSGLFVLMNDQWIVLRGNAEDGPQKWVPRDNVLVLEVSPR
jgi:hypothetical protein